jgi:hypothetical protein
MPTFESSADTTSIEVLKSDEVHSPVISYEDLKTLVQGNEELNNALEDMLEAALQYSITVAEFKMAKDESRHQITEDLEHANARRTQIHDQNIDQINYFLALLHREGLDTSWAAKAKFGPGKRGAYGKFALTLSVSRL